MLIKRAARTIKWCRRREVESRILPSGAWRAAHQKKTELKLTNVAKASLEELRLDYEDFLRQRELKLWDKNAPKRQALVARRCTTADEVAKREYGPDGQEEPSIKSIPSIESIYAELSANAALVLIGVASTLLDHQVSAQAAVFETEGGFTERLCKTRQAWRRGQ